MTQVVININEYLDNVVGKALLINKQALALTIPHIVQDYYPNLTLSYSEDRTPLLCDKTSFWKVVCGRKTFDISPSYTKGHGRSKEGICPISELVSRGIDGVMFVEFSDVSNVLIKWVRIHDLPSTLNGVYKKGEIFE